MFIHLVLQYIFKSTLRQSLIFFSSFFNPASFEVAQMAKKFVQIFQEDFLWGPCGFKKSC